MKNIKTIIIYLVSITFLNAQFNIKGTIIDSKTGESLPNATVYIPELNQGTAADENGIYQFINIPAGTYKIKCTYLGYADVVETISGKKGNIHLDIKMQPETAVCLHQVVITAGTYSTQDESAIKIESINKQDLEGLSGVSLIKDMERIPGIDAISKGNGVATPVIRGLSTSNILVLNNGVKMQNFQFSVNHPYLIDEFGVEKIEIVKGPASLLFGSNAVGGAINFIKENPAIKNHYKADANFNFNTNTSGYVGNAGIKLSPGNTFFGFRAGLKNHMDYMDGKGNIVPNSRFNEKSAKIFAGFNKTNFISKLYVDYNLMNLGLTVPPAIMLFKKNSRNNEFWYQNLSNLLISSKNILYIDNIRNEININYQTNNRKLWESPTSEDGFNTVDMLLNTLTYEVKSTKPFKAHKFILAVQGLNQNNTNADVPEHVLPDFKLNDYAALVLLQLNFKEKIHTQLGLRYDIRNIYIPKQESVNNRIKKNYGNFSYSAGITLEASKNLLFRTNFASGYRTPSIAELSQDGGHGARYEIGDPNLNAQRNYEGDLSMHIHTDKIRFEVSGFYNKIKDYIYLSPTKDTSGNGLPIFRHVQSNAKLYGIETGLGYFPISGVNVNIAYNHLIAQRENGEYLPLIPQNKLRTSISINKSLNHNIFNDIAFDIESILAFKQNMHDYLETNTPGYKIVNMGLIQNIQLKNQNLKFMIKINNLFNETYIDHVSTLKGLGYYNMGRNISLGFKMILGGEL